MGTFVANPENHQSEYCEFDPWDLDTSSQDSSSLVVERPEFLIQGLDKEELSAMAFPARMSSRPVLDGRSFDHSPPEQWRELPRSTEPTTFNVTNPAPPSNSNVQNTLGQPQYSSHF
ncbi:hypothetical protein M758_10G187800, partial [Ceratodon purpureus]